MHCSDPGKFTFTFVLGCNHILMSHKIYAVPRVLLSLEGSAYFCLLSTVPYIFHIYAEIQKQLVSIS